MDYISPKEVAGAMMNTAIYKSTLPIKDLLIRGALSGALLAISVTLALLATSQTGTELSRCICFSGGFCHYRYPWSGAGDGKLFAGAFSLV